MRCTVVLEFDDGDAMVSGRVEQMRFYRNVADPGAGNAPTA